MLKFPRIKSFGNLEELSICIKDIYGYRRYRRWYNAEEFK